MNKQEREDVKTNCFRERLILEFIISEPDEQKELGGDGTMAQEAKQTKVSGDCSVLFSCFNNMHINIDSWM